MGEKQDVAKCMLSKRRKNRGMKKCVAGDENK